jgi:hypothetical protein
MNTLYQSRFGSATEDYILALAGEIDQVEFPWFAVSNLYLRRLASRSRSANSS